MTIYTRGSRSFEMDTREFEELKSRLTGTELDKAKASALRKGSRILISETEKRLSRLVVKNKGGGPGRLTGSNYNGRRLKVATYKLYKNKKGGYKHATVSIRNKSTDFRTLFFEAGTKKRFTRKAYKVRKRRNNGGSSSQYYPSGMYRGRIKEGRYFRRAKQATEQRIFNVMGHYVNGHIIRQARKK